MLYVSIALVIFAAILIQSIAGFGVALVAMPFLTSLIAPVEASTLMAITAVPLQIIILRRYWHALEARSLWRLILGAVVGIPVGVLAIARLDEQIILFILGIVLVVYSLYSMARFRLPPVESPRWGYLFGLASGLLSGAFNTGGPPLVVYGTAREWRPDVFRANLQMLLMVNSTVVIIAHLIAGHMTEAVLSYYVVTLPVVFIGTALGFRISSRVNESVFRRIVLVLLLLIGIRLLFP
ncbi:MAG: sulfite exporter TauE/SafE family protein [Anaerolineae bacterium]|nr:sulfite exporter TauE/SafE family protein [Anaerolineae bacterium]NUQ02655.1 sulfite exporter TauE/SafE family protein [Anaerolineae bacterium]